MISPPDAFPRKIIGILSLKLGALVLGKDPRGLSRLKFGSGWHWLCQCWRARQWRTLAMSDGNGSTLELGETADHFPPMEPDAGGGPPSTSWSGIVLARLLIGLVVFISAEVFSGASIQMGLWHPWTWIVTYWLYFAHFFFFTTLAVYTGRTSIGALYLWGVLFGLYEFWITKVIWNGYGGDGKFVMNSIGPYGYSEISMAFICSYSPSSSMEWRLPEFGCTDGVNRCLIMQFRWTGRSSNWLRSCLPCCFPGPSSCRHLREQTPFSLPSC